MRSFIGNASGTLLLGLLLFPFYPLNAACIVEQRINSQGIYIRVSNGKSISLTKEAIIQKYKTLTGPAADRKVATAEWVIDSIVQELGEDMISRDSLMVEFDEKTGQVRTLKSGIKDEIQVEKDALYSTFATSVR